MTVYRNQVEAPKIVGMLRDGKLWLNTSQGFGYLDTLTGVVVHMGTTTINSVNGGTPVYFGEKLTITFDGK